MVSIASVVPAKGESEPDARLGKRVTLECVGGRLYNAVDKVSSETDVLVRAGTSSQDWKSRDLPILVCAQDIPLGILLTAISDVTHLLLSRSTVDDVAVYRIWRDKKRQNELDSFEKEKRDTLFAAAYYDWEMLSSLGSQSAGGGEAGTPTKRNWPREIEAVSNLLGELGPEARERVLGGETIVLTQQSAPGWSASYYRDAFKGFHEAYANNPDNVSGIAFGDDLLKQSYIRIKVENYGRDSDELSVELYSKHMGVKRIVPFDYQPTMQMDDPQMPARPKVSTKNMPLDALGPRYVSLSNSATAGLALLDMKVKVELPAGKDKPTYSDLLAGVSKATNYSIVAEGRAARWVLTPADQKMLVEMFGKELPVRTILGFAESQDNQEWYLDETSKLILGRDKQWSRRLGALVPERLLVKMQSKLNANGVELDDLEPFIGLTPAQVHEWIGSCPEYPEVQLLSGAAHGVTGSFLGGLYFALDARERAAAKSGRYVSLANIDPSWMCRLLRSHLTGDAEVALRREDYRPSMSGTQMLKCCSLFNAPDSVPELQLRVIKTPLPEPYKGRHQYEFELRGPEGSGIRTSWPMSGQFPIVAPEAKEISRQQPQK